MHDHDPSSQEKAECFGVSYTGPRCEECDSPVTNFGESCKACTELFAELESDDFWAGWIASLKTAWSAGDMDAIYIKLAGWKYVDAKPDRVRLLAPGHQGFAIFTRDDSGMPSVSILRGKDIKFPDWSATFTSGTPHEIILTACNAVIHQN